ncbi:hypothetical protein BEN71_06220 [Acinetobacter wuhouensis]|uniref:Uncharacterized protein n=1 Tax=Acinetobacter wuhouensis TaxID=1879050 RepID=A0A385C467_9GAMM|nr:MULTISPECIES: hypothetical protein [Acinetobacter]AXQ21682.1 hypothetical protein BEN71_06220 [Acinetobacter wuhouensis]AYO53741.1 hypothetical protein CDG68_08920 [Acinetobacter wuhouensis]RZG44816.1 hypothetical protein EXU28_13575 [Acinetobacter wuhouensis]RZG72540.1 hypothetical protein EXU29_09975 [Acinetobacter wuhouensis]RZG76272.1 hypothetical protein EXE09_08460 [Acinetobacter sp. WCHAc060025]
MTQVEAKKKRKLFILATLGLLIPIFILSMAFFAAKSDAETKKEYDKLRLEQEAKVELRKQEQRKNEQAKLLEDTQNQS